MKHAPQKNYLAQTVICDGGSYCRDKDPDAAVARCARITYQDWKHLYKLDGETITVGLWDVTGHDEVMVGDGRCWVDEPNDAQDKDQPPKRTYLKMLKQRKVKLPGKKKA